MNCPELHYECDELCRYRRDDKCYALSEFDPQSIFDLMTNDELISYLKTHLDVSEWTQKQWGIVLQLQSEIRGWRQKYNETLNELAKLKKKKKKPQSRWD